MSANRTKTEEKHQIKKYWLTNDQIHRYPHICNHLTIWSCIFTPRCSYAVCNVCSDLHFSRLGRPDEWGVQESGGDKTQTDAVCVRRWESVGAADVLSCPTAAPRVSCPPPIKARSTYRVNRNMLVFGPSLAPIIRQHPTKTARIQRLLYSYI